MFNSWTGIYKLVVLIVVIRCCLVINTLPGGLTRSLPFIFQTNANAFVSSRVNANMSLATMICRRCDEGFEPTEKIVNSGGDLWHTQCFV